MRRGMLVCSGILIMMMGVILFFENLRKYDDKDASEKLW
jgi:hypothetical protein